ncbi:MAG: tyrosine decarboxylase MfnA [Euryarchaeota archaeon]|nr:tyrosine decarboxylase MfnA [Euryarchaeota archaeon]
MDSSEIERLLAAYYDKDMHYESGKILGSMYSTPPEPVLRAFFKFYQANLGNPGLYPGTVEMEREVVKFLLRLTSGQASYFGHVVSGGTEANIMALWAARNMGYRRILATEDVHFSVLKAANLLSLPVQYVPMRDFVMDTQALEDMLQDRDIVVLTAGTTPTGYIDPVEDVARVCRTLNCYIHVDAAFGGFVIPFLYPEIKFGFNTEGVKSVTIDPHKMGMAPYPAGGIVARENIFKSIEIDAPYLSTGKNAGLLGTRQSGSVAAAYAAILHFGMEGYRTMVKECMANTKYLWSRAKEEGFEVLADPVLNILNIRVGEVNKVREKLFKMGWGISTYPKYSSLRIVVMPHITREVIDTFLKDLKKVG